MSIEHLSTAIEGGDALKTQFDSHFAIETDEDELIHGLIQAGTQGWFQL